MLISKEDGSQVYQSNLNEMEYISKIYNEVVQRAKVLYHQHQTNLSFLRDEFLRNLLDHEMEDNHDIIEQFEKYEIDLNPQKLMVILLRVDQYATVQESLKPIFKIGISNAVNERLNGHFKHIKKYLKFFATNWFDSF